MDIARQMKVIEYRGGVVTFRIPRNWKEEYERDGGGTFYDEREGSGTLRLNIITFKAPPGKLPACGYDELQKKREAGVELIKLPSGDGIKVYRQSAKEDGEELHLYYWEIAHCAPPQKFCMAIFSYTILSSQSSDRKFIDEIQMISDELKQIKFHPDLGRI